MAAGPTIVWFRQDLRLDDNPALSAAVACGGSVVPAFIWSPAEEGGWPIGAASRWWLHHSLRRLDTDLRRVGSRLILRRGEALFALTQLAQETHAAGVYWNRRCEPAARARDRAIQAVLGAFGLDVQTFNGTLLFEPSEVQTREGRPFQVFTPFARACCALPPPAEPLPAPERLPAPAPWCNSLALEELELEPSRDWASGLRTWWTPGTSGAQANLDLFLGEAIDCYAD